MTAAATCSRCDALVLRTTSDRLVTTEPRRLGMYDPTTGDVLHPSEITARIRATGMAGHGEHRCTLGQLPLPLAAT